MIIGVVILLSSILICKMEHSFYILLFCLSNERMFVLNPGEQTFLSFFLGLFALKIFILRNTRIKVFLLFLWLLLFLGMFFKNLYFSYFIDVDIIRFMINTYIFISLTTVYEKDTERIAKNSIFWFSFGCLITSILGMIYYSLGYENVYASSRFAGINNNPNHFSAAITIATSLLLIYYFINNRGRTKILLFVFIIIVFGALSLSRGFLVANIVNLLFFGFVFFKSKLKQKMIIILIAFTILLSGAEVFNDIVEGYTERVKYDEHGRIDSGHRLDIWSEYSKILINDVDYILFGLGQFDPDIYYQKFGVQNVAHNIFLGAIVKYGLILTLIIIFTLYFLNISFIKINKIKKWHFYYSVTLFSMLMGYMFADAISSNTFFYGFLLSNMGGYLIYDYEKQQH